MNLGSGPRGLDDQKWINVEGFNYRNVHILLDASRPLPFPDGSIDGVFCEHVLEHFSLEDGCKIAAEVRRVLADGAGFRIVVPDAALIMRRYFEDPEALTAHRGEECLIAMEVVNIYFRQRYEHQFLYDLESMKKMLLQAGFSRVERQAFGESQAFPHLVLDDKKYEWESLYVEATK
jgi:predicted SAM-dependent methyltransferase